MWWQYYTCIILIYTPASRPKFILHIIKVSLQVSTYKFKRSLPDSITHLCRTGQVICSVVNNVQFYVHVNNYDQQGKQKHKLVKIINKTKSCANIQ